MELPQTIIFIIHITRNFMDVPFINHPAIGVPPLMETSIDGHWSLGMSTPWRRTNAVRLAQSAQPRWTTIYPIFIWKLHQIYSDIRVFKLQLILTINISLYSLCVYIYIMYCIYDISIYYISLHGYTWYSALPTSLYLKKTRLELQARSVTAFALASRTACRYGKWGSSILQMAYLCDIYIYNIIYKIILTTLLHHFMGI